MRLRRTWPAGIACFLGVAVCDEGPALTAFEKGPWKDSALVALAEVEEVRAPGSEATPFLTGRARLVETFKGGDGPQAGDAVQFLVRGPRPTLDEKNPSAPYLQPGSTGRYVLFLARRPRGVAYSLVSAIDAFGPVGEERLESLRAESALLNVPGSDARARQTTAHFLDALRKGGVWTRVHAARELNHIAEVRPDLFDGAARERIVAVGRAPASPSQRAWLQRLMRRLGGELPAAGPPPSPEAMEPAQALAEWLAKIGTDPATRRRAISDLLEREGSAAVSPLLEALRSDEGEALLRVWIVDALAEGGYEKALPHLRRAYAHEEDPDVRAAVVRATGFLGGDDDIAWLAERSANARLRTEVLFALARIRSPRALEALQAVARDVKRPEGEEPTEEDRDIPRLVEYLLSEAFVSAEQAAGRSVGPYSDAERGTR